MLTAALTEILDLSFSAFIEEDDRKARMVEPLEEHIDVLCDTMKLRHVDRLQKGQCSLSQGFVFNDLLTNFERVADHCSNLAVAMIELESDAFDTHDYIINLKELHSQPAGGEQIGIKSRAEIIRIQEAPGPRRPAVHEERGLRRRPGPASGAPERERRPVPRPGGRGRGDCRYNRPGRGLMQRRAETRTSGVL